jgi:hypothetical protein
MLGRFLRHLQLLRDPIKGEPLAIQKPIAHAAQLR